MHTWILVLIILDSYVWINSVGIDFYRYYFIRNVQFFIMAEIFLMYFWISIELSLRFESLNVVLKNSYKCFSNNKKASYFQPVRLVTVSDKSNVVEKLKNVKKFHNFLCDIVANVNDIFGVNILFMIIFGIGIIVEYTILLINYTVLNKNVDGAIFGPDLQLVSAMWIFGNFVSDVQISNIHFFEDEAQTLQKNPQRDLRAVPNASHYFVGYRKVSEQMQDELMQYCIKCLTVIDPGHKKVALILYRVLGYTSIDEQVLFTSSDSPLRPSLLIYPFELLLLFPIYLLIENCKHSLSWIIFIFFFQLGVFLLAYAGNRISSEATKTICICYKFLNELNSSTHYETRIIEDELHFLVEQLSQRKPCLSASGFFTINFTMVGFILSSITSYIIVAIQFLKEDASK
ncbi:uncharacterized protein [Leptinotarsa decemlineata]|uniref:uncharacterized protein n=1 Tax=Leptinotarsa decemlineata TaxID=7539 RepID=UPI003D30CA88